nr:hypothetical protein [Variovorax sp. WDL1]
MKTSIAAKSTLVRPTLSRRRTLHASALSLVEDFQRSGDCAAPSGHSPEYQLVLPYEGAVSWCVGAKTALLDSNSVLFVGAGDDYSESHLVAGVGHASIIITPRLSMLQELCGQRVPAQHACFKNVSATATSRAQVIVHHLLHLAAAGSDPLAGDELTIALLREVLVGTRPVFRSAPLRVVDQAKQFLHASGCEPMTLDDVAHAVGVSGASHPGIHAVRWRTAVSLPDATAVCRAVAKDRWRDSKVRLEGVAEVRVAGKPEIQRQFRDVFAPRQIDERAVQERAVRAFLCKARERTVQQPKPDST